jgi:hypothetical protein
MAARRKETATEDHAPKAPVEERPKAGQGIEVDLDEPEAEEDEPEAPQKTRAEKKQERLSLMEQAEVDREARLNAERAAGQAIGYAQAIQQQVQQQATQQRVDPLTVQRDAILRERELLVQEFQLAKQRGALTPEQERDFKSRGYDIEERWQNNVADRRMAARGGPPPQQNEVMTVLRARYPDVVMNEQAFRWALAEHSRRCLDPRDPAPDNWDTADAVMQATRERFGMGSRREERQPSEGSPRRFEGSSTGASASKGEGRKVALTPEDVALADAAYPDLPQKERYKKYALVTQRKAS